ncbi:MAG: TIGR01777 family oxidoreductase [Longimicrobiales bacterium]|nr:TIGR01777 family oxidoreductase [Longimicrobiales bacterium]
MRFTFQTEIPDHTPEEVFDWHERPGAFERLTPPWGDVEVLHRSGGIKDGGTVSLKIQRGPTSFRWDLRHRDYRYGRQFRDEQVKGPMKSWVHTHLFEPSGNGGTVVRDEIELEPPLGPAGEVLAPALIKGELERLFKFRYQRLFTDLARHADFAAERRLSVAITGASGLVGSSLTHFLTTGGHEVIHLVRDSREVGDGKVFWNPTGAVIDEKGLLGVDAVVHLAGEPIASGRWTEEKRGAIKQSRIQGTELIARTLATMRNGPKVLLSASAVGFYGDRGSETLTESAGSGRGFLAEVCRAWEGATRSAERAGLRVAKFRGGLVLSPKGGALGQMLLPFKMGVGGRLGSGKQYVSWIDLDDHLALLHHALYDESVRGPVNATAPGPVTNSTFTSALGRALGRPTVIPVPGFAVKALFGDLGKEALLWGQRAIPAKATEAGFDFFYESVEDSLRFQLGRVED